MIHAVVKKLQSSCLSIFPINPGDLPEGMDPFRHTSCHCAVGNIYQILGAAGVNIDEELPRMRTWFLRYQLPDGGLNCDNDAYLKDSPPSSMVGTIAPLEAVLFHTNRAFTDEEIHFLDRGAKCLLDRQLMHATTNPHNASEKEEEEYWLKLCFPRHYFYDVLRGLSFVLHWSDLRHLPINRKDIQTVVDYLSQNFPDATILKGRTCYEGVSTLKAISEWKWERRQPATHFPLLKEVSRVGVESPELTKQWNECKELLVSLEARGLVNDRVF